MPLMVSVSGIRGLVGEDITPSMLVLWVAGFAYRLRKGARVVVGGDPRPTREPIRKLVFGTLEFCGCEVFDLGIASTPTIAIAVEELNADGGIALTASHNPAPWNALKFFRSDGRFLLESEGAELKEIVEQQLVHWALWNELGSVNVPAIDVVKRHIERVLQTPGVDVNAIRQAKMTVACDGGAGVAGACIPQLLDALGVKLSPGSLGMIPNGFFQRKLEPTPDALKELGAEVVRSHSVIGFGFDPDGDRLACVGPDGNPIGEEMTIVLTVDQVLRHTLGPVVVNISTTMAVEDVAKRYGVPVYRTKVGESNVAAKMLEVQAVCGGEGNGGVMIPSCHPGRDSLVGIALILSAIATRGNLNDLLKDYPSYTMVKKSVELDPQIVQNKGGIKTILEQIVSERPFEEWDRLDGLKRMVEDGWVQIRSSNTEPILRIFAEGKSESSAENLCNDVLQRIGKFL